MVNTMYKVSVKSKDRRFLHTYTNDRLYAELVHSMYEEWGFDMSPIEEVATYEKGKGAEISLPDCLRRQAL